MKNIELFTTNLPKRSAKIFSVFFYLRNKKGAYSAPKSISYSALPAEPKKSVIMSLTKAVIASAPGFNSYVDRNLYLADLFLLRYIYELLQQILTDILC